MSKAVVTFRLMPSSPEADLEKIKNEALAIAKDNGAIGELQAKVEEVAFGLKAVLILGMYEVAGGDFDAIALLMKEIKNVESAEVTNMDLALG